MGCTAADIAGDSCRTPVICTRESPVKVVLVDRCATAAPAFSRDDGDAHMGQWSRTGDTPPFIELVPPERATGLRKELYDELERVRGPGRVSNLFKAYSAFPELAQANFRRLMVLLTRGSLSVKFKEAVMTALAEANKCVIASRSTRPPCGTPVLSTTRSRQRSSSTPIGWVSR